MPAALMQRPTLGPIEPTVMYPLDVLKAYSGMGTAGLREMRRNGLPVRYIGGRGYVLGSDFIEHVVSNGKATKN